LSGTRVAEPGGRDEIKWGTDVGPNDVLTLVRASAPESQIDSTVRASSLMAAVLKAPDSPGNYEIRYILSPIGRVLARWPLKVEAPAPPAPEATAARADEVTLSAPDHARAGETLTVEWEGPSVVRDRLTIAPPDAPATKWLSSIKVGGEGRADLAAPQEPGIYEVRYLNLDSRDIIARSTLVVE
jgi:Ca-activated chloride channel family protein